MLTTKKYQFWFCTGSQDLYGDECLRACSRAFQNYGGALERIWKSSF